MCYYYYWESALQYRTFLNTMLNYPHACQGKKSMGTPLLTAFALVSPTGSLLTYLLIAEDEQLGCPELTVRELPVL
jgi:hypothetical protein